MSLKKILKFPAFDNPLGRSMTLFLLLLLIIVIFINLWSLTSSWNKRLNETAAEAVNLSVSQARQAEDTFLQTEFTLNDVLREIRLEGLTNIDSASMRTFLQERHERLPQLHGLFIYDAQGNWAATSAISGTPAHPNNADRDYFKFHRVNRDRDIHIGHVIRSRSTGDLIIPVSVRLNDDMGNFAGVVLATVRVNYFRQFYSYFELGRHDVLALILADSTVLYARPFPDSFINQSLSHSPLFTTALNISESGSRIWQSHLDGIERIFGYARLKRFPLIVTAGYDKNALLRQWVADNLLVFILNIMLFSVIVIMGAAVLRQVHASVRNQLELTRVRDELSMLNHTLQSLALLDGLTGLPNRRQFDLYLTQTLQNTLTTDQPVSLIMIDIDFFKRYNDTYGHVAGDECLRLVGETLRDMPRRGSDLIARYGGEEFAIILPDTSPNEAMDVAWCAVNAMRTKNIRHDATEITGGIVTLSAGVSTIQTRNKIVSPLTITQQADQALYEAKRRGRNQAAMTQ